MNIPNISISDMMQQKIAEIQARLPIKMQVPVSMTDFAQVLSTVTEEPTTNAIETANTAIDPTFAMRTAATYPQLNANQVQAIMPRIELAIAKASEATGMDANLLKAMIKQESAFQPFAVSKAGAMGLLQLMPGTADDLGVDDPFNIEQNILGGAQYLKDQMDTFQNLDLALAAYNAGPNAVKKYGGIPPYEETQKFVQLVQGYYQSYKNESETAQTTL